MHPDAQEEFDAPWSGLLLGISLVTTLICLGASVAVVWNVSGPARLFGLIPLAIVVGGALYTVRGYRVMPDAILVRRLFWNTRLPREGLESVEFRPRAMLWSLRLWGNGGLFSFSGIFRNSTLGTYRALVTDGNRTVVLRYARRTVVVSPDDPERFVRALEGSLGTAGRDKAP